MRGLLDWLTDQLVDVMIMIEPRPPRRQELDYHVSKLPMEILAIVRISWYKQGKPDEVDEVVLMEDGDNGYEAFSALIQSALNRGANVSIRSGYQPEDLGIYIVSQQQLLPWHVDTTEIAAADLLAAESAAEVLSEGKARWRRALASSAAARS